MNFWKVFTHFTSFFIKIKIKIEYLIIQPRCFTNVDKSDRVISSIYVNTKTSPALPVTKIFKSFCLLLFQRLFLLSAKLVNLLNYNLVLLMENTQLKTQNVCVLEYNGSVYHLKLRFYFKTLKMF